MKYDLHFRAIDLTQLSFNDLEFASIFGIFTSFLRTICKVDRLLPISCQNLHEFSVQR
jgi:hypothetical protein